MKAVWILGDQLSPEHAALSQTSPNESRVLMIESKTRGSLLRYHQIKLVLVYSAMRHFARELRERNWEVCYYQLEQGFTFESALGDHLRKYSPERVVLAEPNLFFETEAIVKLGRKLRAQIEFVPRRSSFCHATISVPGLPRRHGWSWRTTIVECENDLVG
jgi:deoxyribodipyrimidine photolyase-related protein